MAQFLGAESKNSTFEDKKTFDPSFLHFLANQMARLFKLVYLLSRLTVFCNFLHDGRKPLGEETEYALVVIRG